MKATDSAPDSMQHGHDSRQSDSTQTSGSGRAGLAGDAIPHLTPQRREGPGLKGMLAFGLLVISLIAVATVAVQKFWYKPADTEPTKAPDVASAGANKLRLGDPKTGTMPALAASTPSVDMKAGNSRLPGTAVPAIKPEGDAQALGVVATGTQNKPGANGQQARPAPSPLDAPIFVGQARPAAAASRGNRSTSVIDEDELETSLDKTLASLAQQKTKMEAMLARQQAGGEPAGSAGLFSDPSARNLTFPGLSPAQAAAARRAVGATGPVSGEDGRDDASPEIALRSSTATARVNAQMLAHRTLTIPKGTLFSCALKTRLITATSGLVGCLAQRDVYGHDGKVVLIERGSHLDGEYQVVSVRPGLTRIPVLWTRVLTPTGVTVDLASPATGQLGESGLGGEVDNRWGERIGASLLVSLIDDSLRIASQGGNNSSTVVLSSTTSQSSKLAEEVLKATINIPPLLYANQGGVVGVYVAKDLDFSHVYKLQPQ